jgi:FkbM family methyltransferase
MMTQRHWSKRRFYEGALLQYIRKFQLEGTYIDVGAMLGNHSIFFANFCQCRKLISVEAVPDTYQIMVRNVRANLPEGVVFSPQNYAAYSKAGFIGTWDPVSERNIGGTELTIRRRGHDDTYPSKPPRSINTIRVDDLVKPTDNVAVLKVDIEGGEIQAIIGACDSIARCNPLVVAEALTKESRVQLDEMMAMFKYVRLAETPKKRTFLWWHEDYVKVSPHCSPAQ